MNIFEKLSRDNLIVGTRRLKWFIEEDIIIFYDVLYPTREAWILRTKDTKAMIIEAKGKLFGRERKEEKCFTM